MAPGQKKDRSPDEVAAEFANSTSVVSIHQTVNDEPEPDSLRAAGLTTVGTVDDGLGMTPVAPGATQGLGGVPVGPNGLPAATMENIMLMLVDALQRVASGQQNAQLAATQALEQAARLQQPDNKFAPGINDLNPQGDLQYPKPKLRCQMLIPWEAEYDSSSFEELELLNLLEEGEFIIKRNDGVKVRVDVKMQYNLNGKPSRIVLNSETAFNEENHWMMPPLTSTLRQILNTRPHTKAAAAKVLTMDERVAMVERGELPVSVGQR
jgi:hypothetical protein